MNIPTTFTPRVASSAGSVVNGTVDEVTGVPQSIGARRLYLEFMVRPFLKALAATHAVGTFVGAYCTNITLHSNTGSGDAPLSIDFTVGGTLPGLDAATATNAIAQWNTAIDVAWPIGSIEAPGSMVV